MSTATASDSEPKAQYLTDSSGIAGHPRGLMTLFFTEMWERFSYYGMRALLVLYLTTAVTSGGVGMNTADATAIYGWYTFAVYLTALPGGWIADKFLGAKKSVFFGGIIIAMGHFSLIFHQMSFFYAGLVLIVIGTGLLKPNISALVGGLYGEGDPRRDGGFSIFYMGINLGALFAPLVCGTLAQSESFKSMLQGYGFNPNNSWHWGFGAAGVGMVAGVIQYMFGQGRLPEVGKKSAEAGKAAVEPAKPLTAEEYKRLAVIGILFFFSITFWAAFEQAGSSLNLFADRVTRNSYFGWTFPSSYFQSVNSVFIILLAPLFSFVWLGLGKKQPSSPAKFAYGLFFTGVGFVVLAFASSLAGSEPNSVSPNWLILVYFLHTVGELCLSPVGLSTVTKLSPARLSGLMLGVWFLSISIGNKIGGIIAGNFDEKADGMLVKLFGGVALATILAAVILAVITPYIRKLIGKAE